MNSILINIMFSCSLSAFSLICSIFTIISEIILLLVSILFYFYMDNQLCWNDIIYLSAILVYQIWMILSKSILISKLISILVSKWNMNLISILIEYYLQQSSILSILDFHQISKNRRNIYSFIHIHTNTSDWFGFDRSEWSRKINCLKIRNIYSIFNHSISN